MRLLTTPKETVRADVLMRDPYARHPLSFLYRRVLLHVFPTGLRS
jgi:hypothetical protein